MEPVVGNDIEGPKCFASLRGTLLKVFIEHLLPARRMDAGGVGHDPVEIKEDGVVPVAADAFAIRLRHGSLSGLPKDILTHVTLAMGASPSLPILDREHVRRSPAGSDIVGFRRTNRRRGGRLLSPLPAGELGHVVTIADDELLVVDELVADRLLGVGGPRPKLRHTVDHVAYQVEAIEIVQHAHVEGCRGGALFLVAAHVNVVMTRSPVGQPVNERRVTVESEDDRLVGSEQRIEIVVREAVGVLARWLQLHQIDDIDDSDLQIGRVSSKEVDGGKSLQRRHVTAAGHDDIGLAAPVIAGPLPDAESSFAVLDRLVHRQPLRSRLLARNDDVDVVPTAQTMIGDGQQAIGVRREIDADDLGFLVGDVVEEPRILIARSELYLRSSEPAHQEARPRHDLHHSASATGPGHGGPGLVANAYLEGTYSEVYLNISPDEGGMKRLFTQFSFPGGIPSHVAPETPGSIHEGGELGYALSHAYGAAFD